MRKARAVPAHNLKTTRRGKVKRRNLLWRLRRVLFLGALLFVVGVAGIVFLLSRIQLPGAPPEEAQTTFICDASVPRGFCTETNALAVLHGEENRVYVSLDKIPPVMQNSVLAAEDRDFFSHGGVDPLGIARAAYADIRSKGSQQGGSTITQQYIKNTYLSPERNLTRKLKEAVMAVKFEQKYDKKWILEHYLNSIYFGRGAYGVQAASRAYFGHDVSKITLPESALLAGLIRSPSRAEPFRHPEEAKRRRLTVLNGMIKMGTITATERQEADAWPFDIYHGLVFWSPSASVEVKKGADKNQPGYAATQYFVEYVRKQMATQYSDDVLFGGGLRIYTTLDPTLQKAAFDAVTTTLNQGGDPAGAMVSIDDQGRVKAMMGGTDYDASKVNLATGILGGGSGRQPGSTFKAFALAEAVREGYSIDSVFPSPSSIVFPKANKGADWKVSGGCCGGSATLVQATQNSINTVYAQLALKLGIDKVVGMAHDLGVTAPLSPAYPAMVLGSGEVSVMDMAAAYSTFANNGTRITPRVVMRVDRADGTVVADNNPETTQVLTPEQNEKVLYCLQRVVAYGTGKAAQLDDGRAQAGKTGTTQNNRDAWFAGITPGLTTAVWMGYPIPRPMLDIHGVPSVQGGTLPAEMWKKFMERALAGTPKLPFPEGAGDVTSGEDVNPDLQTSLPSETTPQTTPDTGSTTIPTPATATTSPAPTAPPVTPPPSTAPPATQPPATDPPATQPPATQPPATAGGAPP